jgi:protease I
VEHKFNPDGIEAYCTGFRLLGAQVEFVSRILWGKPPAEPKWFYGDVDPMDDEPWETPRRLQVTRDVSDVEQQLDSYAALIMSANYTSVRLRWDFLPKASLDQLTPADIAGFDARTYVQQPPVVRLFARAMHNPQLIKGALCHGLWVLTPTRSFWKGARSSAIQ